MVTCSELTDKELVTLLKVGNQDAYVEIYDRFYNLLFIYACKIVKDKDEAADLVQEVFIYLWDKRVEITLKTSLAVYLYSAIRYRFFDLLDKRKIRTDYKASLQRFIDKGEYLIDNYIREKELTKLIEQEIAALPPKMREIFEMSRKQYKTHREIATELNLSEKTVKNQINNALKTLRVKLGLFSFIWFIFFH